MWSSVLEKGKLILISGRTPEVRGFHQEIAHYAIHTRTGSVLWCDGDHGFNPYDFAELNLERGFDAEWGADRVLVKRCMTPFQWDSVLTSHLQQKLESIEAAVVIAAPFHGLFSTDELKDWEREDYIAYSLKHLKALARKHRVPIVLSIDMADWCRNDALMAWKTYEGCDVRWSVKPSAAGWTVTHVPSGVQVDSLPVRQHTLSDFWPPLEVMPLIREPARRTPIAQGSGGGV